MTDSNTVKISGSLVDAIDYVDGSVYITDTNDPSAPVVTGQKGSFTITLQCDRNGSSTTAEKFNQGITAGGKHHEFGLLADNTTYLPSKLNFFFQVLISLNLPSGAGYTNAVWLGQGHDGFRNNWWMGGKNMIYVSQLSPFAIYTTLNTPITGKPFFPMIEAMFKVQGSSSSSSDHFTFTQM